MKSIFRRLYWLTRRPHKEAELHEELQFHLEEEAQARQQDGSAEWLRKRSLPLSFLTLPNV